MSGRLIFLFFILISMLFPVSAHGFTIPSFKAEGIASNVQKVAVIGRDDRKGISWKHRSVAGGIGILYTNNDISQWQCTAFCVATNVIATNAHCLLKDNGQSRIRNMSFRVPPVQLFKKNSYLSFLRSNRNGPTSNLRTVEGGIAGLSLFSGDYRGANEVSLLGKDWALAKLEKPICKGRVLKFTDASMDLLQLASRNKDVFMVGFHGDTDMKSRRISRNCVIYSRNNKKYFPTRDRKMVRNSGTLVPHSCDSSEGSSGSPIFLNTRNGPRVIGINLGSFGHSKYVVRRHRYTGRVVERKRFVYRINMAVQPHAFVRGIQRFENEALLSNMFDFKRVQRFLKKLGFYRGPVDGIMGLSTRQAIMRFEKKHNLAAIGVPTQQLLSQLEAEVLLGE